MRDDVPSGDAAETSAQVRIDLEPAPQA